VWDSSPHSSVQRPSCNPIHADFSELIFRCINQISCTDSFRSSEPTTDKRGEECVDHHDHKAEEVRLRDTSGYLGWSRGKGRGGGVAKLKEI
jgi:hypothetical protein